MRTDTLRSVLALIFILLAILSLISFFAPEYKINAQILKILKNLFGSVAIMIPFILGMGSIVFIDKMESRFKELRILFGITALTLALSGFFHVFIDSQEGLSAAKMGEGGGIVGYKILSLLSSALSIYGAVAFLLVTVAISVVIIFNISWEQVAQFVVSHKPQFNLPGEGGSSFFAFWKKKKPNIEEGLEISSGGMFEEANVTETAKNSEAPVEIEDVSPSFEVIPSMAEPRQMGVSGMSRSESLYTERPDIPRLPSDKIWQNPPLDLLNDPPSEVRDTSDVDKRTKIIKDTLKSFGIDVEVDEPKVGPAVTQYSLRPKSVTKISKIASLHEDLALALASPTGSVRIEAPIPGKSLIGIEVPNMVRSNVYLKPLLISDPMKGMKSKLGIVLGRDVGGKTYVYDISKMPHMLIAGTTGSGKSIFIHNIMMSILYRANPQEVRFILVDPKRVELSHYKDLPHLYTPVVTDMDKAPSVFRWAVSEMDRRYKLFEQARVSDIDTYNERSGIQAMPYIIIVVDELGEIMIKDPTGVEKSIIRLAQLARATGIHLVLAVQRPSTNVVTGLIKANISCRIAFNVASQIDSRVIIDQPGAEKLLGKGDMLFIRPDANKPTRLQGAFVSYPEVDEVVGFLKSQGIEPDYRDDILQMTSDKIAKNGSSDWGSDVDSNFDEAVEIVTSLGKASASLLQRKMSIGYARAARIIDEMEEKGIIGPAMNGSKARDVMISGESYSAPGRGDVEEEL